MKVVIAWTLILKITEKYELTASKDKNKNNAYEVAIRWVGDTDCGSTFTKINTHQLKFKSTGEDKHPTRTWNIACWSRRLKSFQGNDLHKKNKVHIMVLIQVKLTFEILCAHMCKSLVLNIAQTH